MTATNHALTGALIGLVTGNPAVAIPSSLLSHYICDMLPHFGMPARLEWLRSATFRNMLAIDALLCILLVGVLVWFRPEHWFLAVMCAFVAAAPDLLWINTWRAAKQGTTTIPNLYSRLAARIQWFEKPIGAFVELAWFAGALGILFTLIRNHS